MKSKSRTSHRDPDVLALIAAGGGLSDPSSLVINQARKLNALYRRFESGTSQPVERLVQLASLKGFEVAPMLLDGRHDTQRDAVVIMADSTRSKGGQIFYNPLRSPGRVAFSIAHEIAHTFFPSTHGGARFREMLDDEEQEASELERLCHMGAAELLMPIEEFSKEAAPDWSLNMAQNLAKKFGSSLEATVFRLATAHPGTAIAGTAFFRHTKGDDAKLASVALNKQNSLFAALAGANHPVVQAPKYRRQSFHTSERCSRGLMIPWNKSFDTASCIYTATYQHISPSIEPHPMDSTASGVMEAICAPFQRSGVFTGHPDVLFLWKAAA
jgi:Zn-dependent peptidase ImmA (M78 family)